MTAQTQLQEAMQEDGAGVDLVSFSVVCNLACFVPENADFCRGLLGGFYDLSREQRQECLTVPSSSFQVCLQVGSRLRSTSCRYGTPRLTHEGDKDMDFG